MKKRVSVVLAVLCALTLTGCAKNDNVQNYATNSKVAAEKESIENNAAKAEEKAKVDTELKTEVELKDFSQLVSFYESDPYYDPERMHYEIYVEKVMYYSKDGVSDETQVIVAGRAMNTEGKTQEATIAAKHNYVDSLRTDGPFIDAKTQWWNEGTAYSADSIIEAALKECGMNQDEMEMNKRYILISTFED